MRTCEFADGFRISAARFAGRTESSAPTAFEKFSRFCVGGDAHIDPMAIADSHWIFVKTAHTAGAMCSIAPYEHPGRVCPYPGGISQIKRILPSRALGREYRNTSWCHPNSGQTAPFGLLVREGDRGRFRPRSAAVLPPGQTGCFQHCTPLCETAFRPTAAAS
mgnify:CR=1 FL=1